MKRPLLIFLCVVLLITFFGMVWELYALDVFAKKTGSARGLIANPRPLDYVNYDYTPNGRHYEFWAFRAPAAFTLMGLILAGATGTVVLRRRSAPGMFGLWASIVGCIAFFLAFTIYQYLIATNAFI